MSGPLTPEQPRRDQVVKDFIQEAERLGTALKSGRIRRWFKGNGPKPTLEYDPETYHEKQRRFWAIEGTGFYVSLRGTVAYRPLDHRPAEYVLDPFVARDHQASTLKAAILVMQGMRNSL